MAPIIPNFTPAFAEHRHPEQQSVRCKMWGIGRRPDEQVWADEPVF
jgi:hypothetical protein